MISKLLVFPNFFKSLIVSLMYCTVRFTSFLASDLVLQINSHQVRKRR